MIKHKIICVGLIGIFLLANFLTVSAVDMKKVTKESDALSYTVCSNDLTNAVKLVEFKTFFSFDTDTVGVASPGTINDAVDNYDLTFTNTGVGDW